VFLFVRSPVATLMWLGNVAWLLFGLHKPVHFLLIFPPEIYGIQVCPKLIKFIEKCINIYHRGKL
jgi:hypothetical protein